jgi:hypothetical protein
VTAGPVPGYLGRVLDADGAPVGTCFQVAPGVLVTAWHVLSAIGAASEDAEAGRLSLVSCSGWTRCATSRF